MKYFFIDESPIRHGKYVIYITPDCIPLEYVENCFYKLIFSKLFNITYADYCRLCRDSFNAVIYGKEAKYPVIYFPNKKDGEKMLNILNERMSIIMNERKKVGEE